MARAQAGSTRILSLRAHALLLRMAVISGL
jgi:hypothetical protein